MSKEIFYVPEAPYKMTQKYLCVTHCGVQHFTDVPFRSVGKNLQLDISLIPEKDIYIQFYPATPYRVIRKNGRKDYHILYVESGESQIYYEGEVRLLHEGEFVVYTPEQAQDYMHGMMPETVICYVHFHGTAVSQIFADSNLSGGFYKTDNKTKAQKLFRKLAHAIHPASGVPECEKNSLLLAILSALSRAESNVHVPEVIRAAVYHLQMNYMFRVDIAQLSEICNLSSSRFREVFKQYVGVPPHQYLLSLRIEHAKELLETTNLSVAAVSVHVGIEDAYYFCRVFKKTTGMTPLAYRKQYSDR